MCRIIDELADKRGIKTEDANYIFANISGYLVNKVPALKEIIDDVFSDETKEDALREHIKKLVIRLQQHNMDVFKTWQMPQQGIARAMGNDLLL